VSDKATPTTARIIDANANRLREGLRVAEEYARLVLGSAPATMRLKNLRHQAGMLSRSILPPKEALGSRNIEDDVGTRIIASDEMRRATEEEVVESAFKRAQESLRVLEEYAKTFSSDAAGAYEKMRYEVYAIEKELLLSHASAGVLADVRLYAILTEAACSGPLLEVAENAITGGCDMIEYREKEMEDAEFLEKASALRELTNRTGTPFIINDRPQIARISGADGVHLGQGDLGVAHARSLLGPGAIIGRSTHSVEQARQAMIDRATYFAIGPVWATPTKQGRPGIGLDVAARAFEEAKLPVFAIGGIDAGNVGQLLAAGAERVAVCRSVIGADDPRAAAAGLKQRIASHLETRAEGRSR